MKGGGKIPYLGLFKWQQIRSHEACNTIYYIFFTHKDIIFSIQIDISTFPEIIITDHVPWTTFFCHQRVVLMLLRYEEQGKVIHRVYSECIPILFGGPDSCAYSNLSRKSGHSTLDLRRSQSCIKEKVETTQKIWLYFQKLIKLNICHLTKSNPIYVIKFKIWKS